eukprot:CAMPEP_0198143966 /NCGR_PEP_ID=MMETSP1443-20131203/12203_1 /TAXON_ID=186043 /ORGANISM="Entomoneis sp., Strain CCMP2396" /LENGTH=424 /DNA_ID=CAMNT_0043807279 /DNA_START=56 /DNA_END=1327 /DNA_ORIENTATION=+
MTSNLHLPGFLRRTLRSNEDDEEDDDLNLEDDGQPEDMRTTTSTSTSDTAQAHRESEIGSGHIIGGEAFENVGSGATPFNSLAEFDVGERSSFAKPTNDEPKKQKTYREIQFDRVMSANVVNMEELRKLSWNGIPYSYRALAWKILLGYVPTNSSRRATSIQRKRSEYQDSIAQHYDIPDDTRTQQEQETLRQVLVDVPRTAPEVPLFRNDRIRRSLSRLLYIWAMRHPASSYVQGINDLTTPLIVVFLSDYYDGGDVLDGHVMNQLTDEQLNEVEADVYGCLTNLLVGIQDHYTSDQPGVQRMVMRLEELVNRIDSDLCQHFADTGIEFIQFSFKWMNCLLLREFELPSVVRLWDTYISEKESGFEGFHVYVCAAFVCQFSAQLQSMNFDDLFAFMQDMPTSDWGDTEIEMLLSQAYVLSTLF